MPLLQFLNILNYEVVKFQCGHDKICIFSWVMLGIIMKWQSGHQGCSCYCSSADIFQWPSTMAAWQATLMERGKQSFHGCMFSSPPANDKPRARIICEWPQEPEHLWKSLYTHPWELMKSVGSGGWMPLSCMMEWGHTTLMGDRHKVKTALWLVGSV